MQTSSIVILEAQFYDVHIEDTWDKAEARLTEAADVSSPGERKIKSLDDDDESDDVGTGILHQPRKSKFLRVFNATEALQACTMDTSEFYDKFMLAQVWTVVCADIRLFHQATINVNGKVTSLAACLSRGREIRDTYPLSDCIVLTNLEAELERTILGENARAEPPDASRTKSQGAEEIKYLHIILAYTTLRPYVSIVQDQSGVPRPGLSATPTLEVRDYITPLKPSDLMRFRTDVVLGTCWSLSGGSLINGEISVAELTADGAYFLATRAGNAALLDLSFGARWAALVESIGSENAEGVRDLKATGGLICTLPLDKILCLSLLEGGMVKDPGFRGVLSTMFTKEARPDLYAMSGALSQARIYRDAMNAAFNSARQLSGAKRAGGGFGDDEAAIRIGEVMAAEFARKDCPLSVTAAAFASSGHSLVLGTNFGQAVVVGVGVNDSEAQMGNTRRGNAQDPSADRRGEPPDSGRGRFSLLFCRPLEAATRRMKDFHGAKQAIMNWLWCRARDSVDGQTAYGGYSAGPTLGQISIRKDDPDPPPFVNLRVTSISAPADLQALQAVQGAPGAAGRGGRGGQLWNSQRGMAPVLVSYEVDREFLGRLDAERASFLVELSGIIGDGGLLQGLKSSWGEQLVSQLQSSSPTAMGWDFLDTFMSQVQYASRLASGVTGGGADEVDPSIDSLLGIPPVQGYSDGQDPAEGSLARRKAAARYAFSATTVDFL